MQNSPPYVLCLDGGTESIRVGIIDRHGNLLSVTSQPYTTQFPYAGWAEQEPGEWWFALVSAVRACLAQSLVKPEEIAGISLDATTCTLIPLGSDLQPLRPALLWMDVRAADQAARIFETGHPALRYSLAGCSAEWMPSKALWLAENEPEVYNRTAYFIEYTDWLIYRLTGRLALNLNTVTQRWYYNSREWGWPSGLFDQVGLDGLIEKFPSEILPVGQEVGCLLPEAAKEIGLPQSVRVFQGGGDAFIGLLGLNVARPGKIGLITGSSNVIAGFVEAEFHGAGLYGAFPDAVIPGLWLIEGGQVSTGSVLAWFKRNFARDLPDGEAYKILDSEASQVLPGSGGIISLDYFQGNRTPFTDAKARGAVWGLSLHATRAEIFHSLMEGVAYGTRLILDGMAAYGQPVHEIYACGGATRSDLFMQIYADVCGIPISVVKVADAPLLGGAVLAFTGLGMYPDLPTAADKIVKVARSYVPDPARHQAYEFYFDLYKQTYHQLKSLMHQSAGSIEIH